MIFQKIGGQFIAVDSAENSPPTLADTLSKLNIEHMMENSDLILHKSKKNKILSFIVRYNILRDGKHVECNIKGWQTALAHARKWQQDLFYNVRKVEIVNLWTGEIITLEEAEKRAKKYAQKLKGAFIGGTT